MSEVQPDKSMTHKAVTYTDRFKDAKSAILWVESKPRILDSATHVGQPYFENKIPYAPWAIDCTIMERI